MKSTDNKHKKNTPIKESEREELARLREENRLLKMKIIFEKATSLASGTGSRSKAKTKIILELIKEYPEKEKQRMVSHSKTAKIIIL